MERITIEVSEELAKKWRSTSAQMKNKIEEFLRTGIEKIFSLRIEKGLITYWIKPWMRLQKMVFPNKDFKNFLIRTDFIVIDTNILISAFFY